MVSAVIWGFNESAPAPAPTCKDELISHLPHSLCPKTAKRWSGEARAQKTNQRLLEKPSNGWSVDSQSGGGKH